MSTTTSQRRAFALASFATAVAAGSVATAWGFQVIGGYLPCHLCLLQRNPYYVGIPVLVAAMGALASGGVRAFRLLTGAAAVVFLVGAMIGIYHAGAEWHLWAGPSSCGATANLDLSAGDLLAQLQATKVVSCMEASFRFLGLSFAGWNVVASGIVAAVAASAARAVARRGPVLNR